MKNIVTGAILTLIALGLGLFWHQGRAEIEQAAPPPASPASIVNKPHPDILPIADAADMIGPSPPEASELTKEQQRFFRYDHNRNWRITRTEMLSTRSDGFRKLDKDGNNLLTFEEWAVATVNKFETADADGDNELTPREFASTRPKPTKKKPSCAC